MTTKTETATDFIHPLDKNHPDHEHYLGRLLKTAQRYAGNEPVSAVEMNDDRSWYAFTTELGMYRLADSYSKACVSKGYSKGYGAWFVRIQAVHEQAA